MNRKISTACLIAVIVGAGFLSSHKIGGDKSALLTDYTVIDGDSIRSEEGVRIRYRLENIDAFEEKQHCGLARCGTEARDHLRNLTGGKQIRCDVSGLDRYGRSLATCYAGASNLNRQMVLDGYALAYRDYSAEYVIDEVDAQTHERGAWQYKFQAPWDYRKEVRERINN